MAETSPLFCRRGCRLDVSHGAKVTKGFLAWWRPELGNEQRILSFFVLPGVTTRDAYWKLGVPIIHSLVGIQHQPDM